MPSPSASPAAAAVVDIQNVHQEAEDLVMELDRNDDRLFHDPTIKHLMLLMQMTKERNQTEVFDGALWTHMRKSEMMDLMMGLNNGEKVADSSDENDEMMMDDVNGNDELNVSTVGEMRSSGGGQDVVLEPVECEGLRLLLPMDLLRFPQVLNEIFSMKTWNERLSDEERAVLRRFLPSPPSSTVHRSRKGAASSFSALKEVANDSGGGSMSGVNRRGAMGKKMVGTQQSEQQNVNWYNKTLEKLFSGENFNFGNDVQRFKRNLLAGQYHPLVYRQRRHVLNLKRLDFKINHELFLNKIASSLSRKYGSRQEEETSQQVDEEQLVLAGRHRTLIRFAALQAKAMGNLAWDEEEEEEEEEFEEEDEDLMVDDEDNSDIEEEAFSDEDGEDNDEGVSVGEMDDDIEDESE